MNGIKVISHSPYNRGAHKGIYLGIFLSCLFFANAYSLEVPYLAPLSCVMMCLVPVIVYINLRRSFIQDNEMTIFSALWLEGIVTFMCGGLISTFVATLFMQYIHPGFLNEQIQLMIDLYSNYDGPQGQEFHDLLVRARDQHLIPRPINLSIDMLWLIVFSGSILSMLMALLVRALGNKDKRINS